MSDETKICNVCNKLTKKKNANKHNKSKRHIGLSSLVVHRFTVKNSEFMAVDEILKKYPEECKEKFQIYSINCYISIVITNGQIHKIKLKRRSNLIHPTFMGRKLLLEIYNQQRYQDYVYSYISEMKIEFNTCLSSMTFKNYLQQPKQMIEWSFIKKRNQIRIF